MQLPSLMTASPRLPCWHLLHTPVLLPQASPISPQQEEEPPQNFEVSFTHPSHQRRRFPCDGLLRGATTQMWWLSLARGQGILATPRTPWAGFLCMLRPFPSHPIPVQPIPPHPIPTSGQEQQLWEELAVLKQQRCEGNAGKHKLKAHHEGINRWRCKCLAPGSTSPLGHISNPVSQCLCVRSYVR